MIAARTLAFGLLLLAAAAPARAQQEPLAPGVSLGRHVLEQGVDVAVVTVEPGAARLKVMAAASSWLYDGSFASARCSLFAPAPGPAGQQPQLACRRDEALQQQKFNPTDDSLLLREYLSASGALAVVSGGYMESFAPPVALGYVSVDGVELSRLHASWLTSAAVCQRGDEVVIGPVETLDLAAYEGCLQAGPLIATGGVSRYATLDQLIGAERRLAWSVQEQAFVCLDATGRLLIGSSGPVSLIDMARFVADTLGCREAMRLSGSITAGLVAGETTFGHNEVPLHNVLGIMLPP